MTGTFDRHFFHWIGVVGVTVLCLWLQGDWKWLSEYPGDWVVPVSDWLNAIMDWIVKYSGWFFLGVSWVLEWPIDAVRVVLNALPWSVTTFVVCVVAYAASGWKLSLFAFLSMLYMVVIGYWFESMNTLSLVAISVPMAIVIGFSFGVWGFFSKRAERVIMPMLDLFQTVPTFAYLLPILMLFGFGTVVGLIASVMYSFPPMVRNTIVGLRGVSPEVIESGLMSGATQRQLFWQVRVPSSMRQILLGVNQATMASLSMVIIASIIGGTEDIGWEVLTQIRKAQFGESLLAGLVIALMAMVIDRITAGLATRSDNYETGEKTFIQRYRLWIIAAIGSIVFGLIAQIAAPLNDWPRAWEIDPSDAMNSSLTYLIVNFRPQIEAIKTFAFFFVMLPAKIGLQQAVSPFTWGFALTTTHKIIYAAAILGMVTFLSLRGSQKAGISVLISGIVIYFGLAGMPWPALVLIGAVAGLKIGGPMLAAGTAAGLMFIVMTGTWSEAILSIYLCGIAVVLSFVAGSAIGIWAAHNETVSRVVRPFNDTLQTMPLFVLLIPFVMIFKIGEFTALLAIIAYAIVPAIRYGEHGLRSLPDTVIEAATMIGATRSQMLWQVKIPLALPVMMLGLNQTIMYGIAMLVIAALVGTNGLEQIVYIGLSDGDFGVGIVAGIGMAIIAIIADRMTNAWSRKRQQELGLSPS
ncbi:MAG: glycine/betaine ABC transporter permease [SAR116 cluster bacterium MED-G04]|jgi:glycine betaine/proline transport system permease protein|nr:MAG: glycine/betaine ABC transporter permease [SAR116 cluster bacterium MED-G04]CAI8438754.1 MAG: Glycine betaine transport system permease protein OpuAB [SAR116 cluster bacterium MED-G04]HCD49359.1 glycine/betaine ABC transporter permease [Alphaproteobacteria bacterium]